MTCGGARRQTVKCELFETTARGSSCSTPLDMAMVAWGSGGEGVWRLARRAPFYFVHSMPAGIKWPRLVVPWFLASLLKGD